MALQGSMPTAFKGVYNIDQIIFTFVWQVGFTLHELTSHERIEYQKKVIGKCLKQPFLQHVMLDFVWTKTNCAIERPPVKISN